MVSTKGIWRGAAIIASAGGALYGFFDGALKGDTNKPLPDLIRSIYEAIKSGGVFASADPLGTYIDALLSSKSFAIGSSAAIAGWFTKTIGGALRFGIKGFSIANVGRIVMKFGLATVGGTSFGTFLDPNGAGGSTAYTTQSVRPVKPMTEYYSEY